MSENLKLLFISSESYTGKDEIWKDAMLAEFPNAEFMFWSPNFSNFSEIDYAITWKPPIGVLKKCVKLKAILSLAAGVDNILADPNLPNVPIIRLIDSTLTHGMVEFVLHWVLHYHRDFDVCLNWQRQKYWGFLPQCDPKDRKIGIMGLGELGCAVAEALIFLNFNVSGWSRSRKNQKFIKSFAGNEELTPFLNRTEILICLLPLTQDTKGIIKKETLLSLPKGAVIINAGRGEHMIVNDVLNSLDSDHLRGAVLDVFPQEPLPADDKFWTHPKVIVTPHTASQTIPKSASKNIAQNIRLIEAGKLPLHVLDIERGY